MGAFSSEILQIEFEAYETSVKIGNVNNTHPPPASALCELDENSVLIDIAEVHWFAPI